MSPITRKVAKYMGWQEICHGDKIDVVRGQFLRMYETLVEREKKDNVLPIEFREDIKKITSNREIKKLTGNMDMNNIVGLGD